MTIDWNQIQDRVRLASLMTGPKEAVLREAKFIKLTETGTGAVAKLRLQSRLSASMLERLLLPDLRRAFEFQTGRPTEFELEVTSRQECFPLEQLAPDIFAQGPAAGDSSLAQVRFRERLTLDETMNFDSFIQTNENRFALQIVREFSLFSNLGFSVVTIHGPAGVGKSHLLHGAGLNAKLAGQGVRVKVITGDDFITDFQTSIAKKNMGDFKRRYRLETDLLLVDDLHSLCRAKATQEEFFNLLNHIASSGRRIMITSDRTIASLDGLEERIKSRLSGGLVIAMDYPSEESRCTILTQKLQANGMKLEPAITKVIARKAGPCVRTLEGMVNKITMLARANQLNREMLNHLVGGLKEPELKLTPLELMQAVSEKYGITLNELRGRARSALYVTARRESMRRLKVELGLSVAEIGRLHLRNHSTVLNALKKA